MKLSAPKYVTWLIALIVGALGILGHLVVIDYLTQYSFWLLTVGFVLLVLGTYLRGL